jgi:hypothetical protein
MSSGNSALPALVWSSVVISICMVQAACASTSAAG